MADVICYLPALGALPASLAAVRRIPSFISFVLITLEVTCPGTGDVTCLPLKDAVNGWWGQGMSE